MTNTHRTPQDYAIEFGEYLAKAADLYMLAVAEAEEARGDTGEDAAHERLLDAHRSLRLAVHEFRKRKV